ncbi:MAG: histone deacetylase, partial [Polyangiaceae bacterium]
MVTTLAVVDDELFDRHRALDRQGAPAPHPERPERLQAARQAVQGLGESFGHETLRLVPLAPRDATDEELERVHGAGYLSELDQARGGSGHLDADTYYAPESVAAAVRACGGSIALVDELLDGNADFGVALLRPPGHHARPDAAMGFCLLNNVAVAAAHARARGLERVMIIDWDVHHGNGTQEMFYDDPTVLYASLHQFPFYPGTGSATEVGSGDGRGYTVNVPLSAGAGEAVYIETVRQLLAPVIAEYDPELLLISAGFDAHARDPLAGMALNAESYPRMLSALTEAWSRGARGRLGLLLEGGYDLQGLEASLGATLRGLLESPERGPTERPSSRHESELWAARSEAKR